MSGPRVILAGAVGSTLHTLQALLKHNIQVVGTAGLDPRKAEGVSGYVDMNQKTEKAGITATTFVNINDESCIRWIRSKEPDVLFVVGLSQLVKKELLNVARIGNIGFHPTLLPIGRGRAPLVWVTEDRQAGAATFFVVFFLNRDD